MTFDDWFDEIEGYSLRSERFYEDIQSFNDPARMLLWLMTAYAVGREHEADAQAEDLAGESL